VQPCADLRYYYSTCSPRSLNGTPRAPSAALRDALTGLPTRAYSRSDLGLAFLSGSRSSALNREFPNSFRNFSGQHYWPNRSMLAFGQRVLQLPPPGRKSVSRASTTPSARSLAPPETDTWKVLPKARPCQRIAYCTLDKNSLPALAGGGSILSHFTATREPSQLRVTLPLLFLATSIAYVSVCARGIV